MVYNADSGLRRLLNRINTQREQTLKKANRQAEHLASQQDREKKEIKPIRIPVTTQHTSG